MSLRLRLAALLGGTLVLTLAWYMLGIKPSMTRLDEVKAQITTVNAEVTQLEARLAELQQLKRDEVKLRADEARLKAGLPEEHSVSEFVRQLQRIANETDIDFASLSPTVPADTPGGPKGILVTLTLEGTFFDFEDYIARMERLERAVRINTFSLTGTGGDLSLNMSVGIFTAPKAVAPEVPVAGAATPAPGASPGASPPAEGTAIVPEAVPG